MSAWSSLPSLEYELEPKLNNPRTPRTKDMAELFRTIRHGVVGVSKIDIVKNVEELSPELNRSLFGDPCCFQQTKIGVEQFWPTQNVFAGTTKGSDGILDK